VPRLFVPIILLAGGFALAQNPAALSPPGPGAAVDFPGGGPGAGALVKLQFPNTDVREVLSFYERLTKKRLIVDNQVQGSVNIVVPGQVTAEEAIRIIEINLLLNGYTLVPAEHSDIVKVIGVGKNPRTAAVPIISDELELPDGEQVVTFIFKLHYADPQEVQQALSTYVVPAPGGFTNITALPKSQTLLITENTATIRGLLRVLHEIDVPPAEVVSEFIPLQRADAKDILEKLTTIFEKKEAEKTTGPRGATPAAPATLPGAVPPGAVTAEATTPGSVELRSALSEDSIIVGKIKLTADIRTNRIHVITRPVNMPFIRNLISEFDSSVAFGEPVSRPLRYISVGDVLDVVVKAITDPGMKEEGGGAGGGSSKGSQQGSGANRPTGTGAATGATNTGSSTDSSGGSGSSLNVSEGLSTEAVDTTPEARVIGTTKIIADKNANSIIVIGSADVKAKVFRLLDELDQRIPQVMLQTVVGELNLDAKEQFGVDYVLRSAGLGLSPIVLNGSGSTTNNTTTGTAAAATGSGNAGTSTTTGTGTTTTTGTTTGTGGSNLVDLSSGSPSLNLNNLLNQNTIRAVAAAGGSGLTGFIAAGDSMTAIVNALMNTNKFRVITRPSVFTRNNKKAIIASGQEIPVPTSIQSAVNSVSTVNSGLVTQSSVEFKNITLQLEVVPLINSEREVSLDVLQKLDQVSGSTTIDGNAIPNIATRYVKTSVTVPNHGTVVLGGLIQESLNKTRSGIPWLSNIPVLGYLFSNTQREKIRTELIILIRPEVSWAPPETAQIRERAQEILTMDPDLENQLFPQAGRNAAAPEKDTTPAPRKRPTNRKATPSPATPFPETASLPTFRVN
jgi:type II secretion system protein D